MAYYGQFGTDAVAEKYLEGIEKGGAIEVGAAHGIAASNTLHFEQQGWTVLCIEANPHYRRVLPANRPHAMLVAVGAKDEEAVDFNVVTLTNGDQSAISGLQLDQKLMASHKDIIQSVGTITVQVKTLDRCIREFGEFKTIDFVSIDTEGTELDVLKGFDVGRWMPRLIVIENNHSSTKHERYLKSFGYKFAERVEVNDFFVYYAREDEDEGDNGDG